MSYTSPITGKQVGLLQYEWDCARYLVTGPATPSTAQLQATSDATDTALLNADSAYTQNQLEAGLMTQEQADQYNATAASDIGYANTTPDAAPKTLRQQYEAEANGTADGYQPADVAGQEFEAGKAGALQVANGLSAAANSAGKNTFQLLWALFPWWVWAAVAFGLYWWLNGGKAALVKRLKI